MRLVTNFRADTAGLWQYLQGKFALAVFEHSGFRKNLIPLLHIFKQQWVLRPCYKNAEQADKVRVIMGIRKAVGEDSAQIAPLILSSGPVAFEHIFSREHGPYIGDFLQREFADSRTMFSHRHHHVFEIKGDMSDGQLVGSIGSFDTRSHNSTFRGDARAIFTHYGWRGIVKGLLFELRLVKAPRKDCLYLCHIAVRPDCRGQGIAAKMINFMMVKAREGGYRCLSLDVAEQNTNALRLYQQMGFKVLVRSKSYNAVLDNHLYMELDL